MLRQNRTIVFASLIALSLCVSSWGQGVRLADGSAPQGDFETDGAGDPKMVWVAFEGYQPLQSPKLGSPVQSKKMAFLESAVVAKTFEAQGKQIWFLIGTINAQRSRMEQYWGWINAKYCITRTECLKTPEGIFKKAMIVNADELDEQSAKAIKEGKAASVAVVLAPHKQAAEGKNKFLWFSFFFVYAEADGYALIGSSPTFSADKAPQIVKGWVPESNLCRWNTREAYSWDRESTLPSAVPRRTHQAVAYRQNHHAYAALRLARRDKLFPPLPTHDSKIHEGRLMAENFDQQGVSRELNPYEARFPRLDYEGTEEYPNPDPKSGLRLLHIGCIGGVGKYSSTDVEKMRQQLNELLVETSTIEIVFLIDDTLSMERWFSIVSQTVNQIKGDVEKEFGTGIEVVDSTGRVQQIGAVKIAISYYNDRRASGGQHLPESNPLRDLKTQGAAIIKSLEQHKPVGNLVLNNREMVFDGIRKAHAAANFSSDARRVVILLGDFGDVSEQDPKQEAVSIARLFEAYSGNPIEFYPIQVVDRQKNKHVDYDAFYAQMEAIQNKINVDANSYLQKKAAENPGQEVKPVQPSKFFGVQVEKGNDASQVSDFVLQRYRLQKQRIAAMQEAIRKLMHGDWGTVVDVQLMDSLQARNFPVKDLMAQRGTQMFERGYVWEQSGLVTKDGEEVPQVRLWALMNRVELELLKNTIMTITEDGRSSPEALHNAVKHEIDALTGDTVETTREPSTEKAVQRTLAAAIEKKIPGLKSHLHSQLLTAALENADLLNLHKEELVGLHRRALLLEDILNRQQTVRKEEPNPDKTQVLPIFKIVESKLLDRTYRIPDSPAVWYWIDVKKELP